MDKWTNRFLKLALEVSTWSKDPSTKVGCVLVHGKNHIISLGYNGYPPDEPDTLDDPRDVKYQKTLHAEHNALRFAGDDIRVKGCTAYVTHHPCPICMAKLADSRIGTVVHLTGQSPDFEQRWECALVESADIATRANIILIPVDINSVT